MEALPPKHDGGRPRAVSEDQAKALADLVRTPPTVLNLPWTQWSLGKSHLYATKAGIIPEISLETLRTTLIRSEITYQPTKTWKISNDPEVQEKFAQVQALYKQCPEDGVVVGVDALETLARELCEAGRKVLDAEPWLQAACAAGLRSGTHRKAWDRLLAQIETVQRLAADAQETLIRFNPRPAPVAQVRLEEQARILREIVQALGPNGALGGLKAALHPSWRRLAGEASVRSGMPRTGQEFQAVLTVVELELAREELRARWDYLVSRAGGPPVSSLGPECEETAAQWIRVAGAPPS
ncbi:MAG TPA: hypothetical protein GXX55_00380 [Firmicutes bacterium]|nr:hypothetical protein [Bacillota bacterium]